jgi:hypothetical protein
VRSRPLQFHSRNILLTRCQQLCFCQLTSNHVDRKKRQARCIRGSAQRLLLNTLPCFAEIARVSRWANDDTGARPRVRLHGSRIPSFTACALPAWIDVTGTLDGPSASEHPSFRPPGSRDLPLLHLLWSAMRLVGMSVPAMYYDIERLWGIARVWVL